MNSNHSTYEELLSRQYGALAIREQHGKRMITSALLTGLMAITALFAIKLMHPTWDHILTPPKLTKQPIRIDLPPMGRIMPRILPALPFHVKVPSITNHYVPLTDELVPDTLVITLPREDVGSGSGSGTDSGFGGTSSSGTDVSGDMGDLPVAMPTPDEFVAYEKEPELLVQVQPRFPETLRAAWINGMVVVQFLVTKGGEVMQPRIVKASPSELGFEQAALEAVQQWKFKPAVNNDKPVAVWITQTIRFTVK